MAEHLDPMEIPCILCGAENKQEVTVPLSLCEEHEDADVNARVSYLRTQLQQAERQALLNLGQAWQREDITQAQLQQAIERAEAAEALAEEQQEDEAELVNACIWNLEQCPGDHCNDVTRVHDRLLERRGELAPAQEGCTCGGVLRHPCGPKCLAPAEAQARQAR